MSEIIKVMALAIILGIEAILGSTLYGNDFSWYIIQIAGLGRPGISIFGLFSLCTNMMPLLVSQIIFGMQIYRHFCTASVYFFSRQKNKVQWYIKECLQLYWKIILYTIVYLGTIMIMGNILYGVVFSIEEIQIFLYILIYFSLYILIFSILLNACSVLIGNHMAFIVLYAVQIGIVLSLMLYQNGVPQNGIRYWLFKCNPVANIIIAWHSSNDLCPNLLNYFPVKFGVNWSIVYLILLTILAVLMAGVIICREDISLENKEERD